ncbi:MAG: TonB-system energizer ExbB [Sulfuricurvum sp.]|uniref:TonB-system energizer ExbB n=1 Tax=Sulfuricurvum sp. TaxID=2025608 RepID=UPI00262FB1AA|nr:TonB-system energizer ExbB [Sulfuricurvum sp.]MDD2830237.1 TonB-system energizer ExbB [Sulfuricurvum sp.]MDD4948805.1 TonB-system energizer ExbB [Sulfuricurvum sp.]
MVNSDWLEVARNGVDYGIIGLLLLMSFVSLSLFIERLMVYGSLRIGEYKSKEELELDLGNHVGVIATIGANAPYIGLLGTVLGIMITFYSLGDIGAVDPKKIMTGLALALKATAMGLIVAIPAIVFYNILLRKMERLLTAWEINTLKSKGVS